MRGILLPLVLISIFACNSGNTVYEDYLINKKWRYDEEAIRTEVSGKPLSNAEEQHLNFMLENWRNMVIEFQEDGVLIVDTGNAIQKGTWEISDDGKALTMILIANPKPSQVLELNNNRLVLAEMPGTGIFFRRILVPVNE